MPQSPNISCSSCVQVTKLFESCVWNVVSNWIGLIGVGVWVWFATRRATRRGKIVQLKQLVGFVHATPAATLAAHLHTHTNISDFHVRLTTTISSHKHNKCTHRHTYALTRTHTHTHRDTAHSHAVGQLWFRGHGLSTGITHTISRSTHTWGRVHTDTHYTLHITHYVYAAWHRTSCCIVNYVLRAIRIRLSCRLSGPCKYNTIDKGLGKMKAEACEACRTFPARGKWHL